MRSFILATASIVLMANVSFAQENQAKRLSPKGQQMLGELGLSGLQPIEKKAVSRVRGTGGGAANRGRSFIVGMLLEGISKSYVYALGTNMGFATLDQCEIVDVIDSFHFQNQYRLSVRGNKSRDFDESVLCESLWKLTLLLRSG